MILARSFGLGVSTVFWVYSYKGRARAHMLCTFDNMFACEYGHGAESGPCTTCMPGGHAILTNLGSAA
jgi:hypothetical protein